MRRSSTDRDPGRLGRLETLGAWLGLWTPPRGTVVPPVPWRATAVGAALLVVALGAAAVVVLPELAENRQAAREREQRIEAERHAAFLAMVGREQRPRRAGGRPDPGRGATAARRIAARRTLLAEARSGIERDARRRTGRDIRGVECDPFPRTLGGTEPVLDLARRAAAYDCVAVTARFGDDASAGGRGIIGISFRLVVRFHAGRSAWCRIIPLGDRDRLTHPLPSACRERRGS
jgi:hypothetical protein